MYVNEQAVKEILEKVKPAKLVAATKYVDEKEIEKLEECGCIYFGENRVQAFLEKYEQYLLVVSYMMVQYQNPHQIYDYYDKVSIEAHHMDTCTYIFNTNAIQIA